MVPPVHMALFTFTTKGITIMSMEGLIAEPDAGSSSSQLSQDIWFEIIDNGTGQLVSGQWVDFNPTLGGYPEGLVWQNVGSNPLGITSNWLAELVDGTWEFTPPPPPSAEEVAKPILFERNYRVSVAAPIILQFECLLKTDELTEDEAAKMAEYEQYIRALARLNEQPGFPYTFVWPVAPT